MRGLEEAIDYCINHEEQSDWCNGVVVDAFFDEWYRLYIDLDENYLPDDELYDSLNQKRRDRVDEKLR